MKHTIAIIAGGYSSEHDVSLRSAAGISSWLDRTLFDIYVIEVDRTSWSAHLADGTSVPVNRHDFTFIDGAREVRPDYAYITIHGTPGEDGILQGYFDLLRIPYSTSGVLVEALTFSKFTLNQYLHVFGVRIAESLLLRRREAIDTKAIGARVGYPCFVKPNAGGSSFGVTRCHGEDELEAAIASARGESDDVIIESELSGTEISNGVYRDSSGRVRVLPITEVVSQDEFFDYDAKYNGRVSEITPARLSDDTTRRVQALTEAIYGILGAEGIIRIDYIVSRTADGADVLNLLEINTTPGMTATSFIPQQVRAAGLDMTAVLTDIILPKLTDR